MELQMGRLLLQIIEGSECKQRGAQKVKSPAAVGAKEKCRPQSGLSCSAVGGLPPVRVRPTTHILSGTLFCCAFVVGQSNERESKGGIFIGNDVGTEIGFSLSLSLCSNRAALSFLL